MTNLRDATIRLEAVHCLPVVRPRSASNSSILSRAAKPFAYLGHLDATRAFLVHTLPDFGFKTIALWLCVDLCYIELLNGEYAPASRCAPEPTISQTTANYSKASLH